MTMSGFLPWWLGAGALAAVTVGSCIVARRPLGVSGIVARFVNLRAELAADRERAAAAHVDEAALEAALLEATAEAFGPLAPPADPPARSTPLPVLPATAAGPGPHAGCRRTCGSARAKPTLGAHALFLGGIVAGGFLAAVLRGGFRPSLGMGDAFAAIVGGGGRGLAALAVGGLLVGIGTSVSGGCSTGHGLSGCSRLQPAGVAATATFLATAVAVSLALAGSRP